MASIANDSGGRRRILFTAPDGKRMTLRLGKVPQRFAVGVKLRVEELLAAKLMSQPISTDTARWVAELDPTLADKLARVGLIARADSTANPMLSAFVTDWLSSRAEYKPASRRAWRQVTDALTTQFGNLRLSELSRDDAEAYRQKMIADGLRATTIHKRLNHARMIFGDAVTQGLIERNPFLTVRHRAGDVSERRQFVPAADVLQVIEHCPNTTWKLLVALARFAGLHRRVPPKGARAERVGKRQPSYDSGEGNSSGRSAVLAPALAFAAG